MANEFDYADKLVNDTIHDIALVAMKLSHESQGSDPAAIADDLWEKYMAAKRRLMEKTRDVADTIRNNRDRGIF